MIQKVVFVDLDGTLFDSKAALETSLKNGLSCLNIPSSSIEDKTNLYMLLYSLSSELQNLFNISDIRQVWNAQDSYALLIALFKYLSPEELTNIVHYLQEDHGRKEQKAKEYLWDRLFFDEEIKEKINNEINILNTHDLQTRREIHNARQAFESTDIKPYLYDDAEYFLSCLEETLDTSVYIVSEGNPETQWWKINKLGIDKYISEHHYCPVKIAFLVWVHPERLASVLV